MNNSSVRKRIIDLAVGCSIEVGSSEIAASTLRQYVSNLGSLLGREYHSHRVDARDSYVITREA